jgi:hypothetical protein
VVEDELERAAGRQPLQHAEDDARGEDDDARKMRR